MQPWEGRSLLVWNMTNVDDVIAKAKAMNADSVIVKSHNGNDYWSQFSVQNVQKLQRAGLIVGAWGYCYPSTKSDCILKTFANGAEFYVCDAEIEFEHTGLEFTVDILMGRVRAGSKDKPVGFTSFAFPSYHPDFPWKAFVNFSDFTMPQIYWGDFKQDVHSAFVRSVAEYRKLGKPVVPIGQLYGGVSNSEIAMFLQLSGASSSWWDYKDLSPNQYSTFSRGGASMQQGSTGPEVVQLQKELSEVLKITLKQDGDYGPVTTSAVKSFQQIYNVRPVTGRADDVTLAVLKHEVSLHTPAPAPIKELRPMPTLVEPSKPEPANPLNVQVPPAVSSAPKSNVAQARELITQALKLLEGVE